MLEAKSRALYCITITSCCLKCSNFLTQDLLIPQFVLTIFLCPTNIRWMLASGFFILKFLTKCDLKVYSRE